MKSLNCNITGSWNLAVCSSTLDIVRHWRFLKYLWNYWDAIYFLVIKNDYTLITFQNVDYTDCNYESHFSGHVMKAAEHYEAFYQLTEGSTWKDEAGRTYNSLACEHLWRIYTLLADKMLENKEQEQAIKMLRKAFIMAKAGRCRITFTFLYLMCMPWFSQDWIRKCQVFNWVIISFESQRQLLSLCFQISLKQKDLADDKQWFRFLKGITKTRYCGKILWY